MLFRAFFTARRPWVLGLLALGVAVGALEGGFVLLVKRALSAENGTGGLAVWILAAFAVVTARSALQLLAARVEIAAVFGWTAERRRELLALAGEARTPAYRDPHRGALVAALDRGLPDLAEGASAGLRAFSAAVQAMVLAPLLLAFSWRPALAALLLALPALWLSRARSARLAGSARRLGRAVAAKARRLAGFASGLETAAGNGRLAASAAAHGEDQARHEAAARGWEGAKAYFPPLLEWAFFAGLAALLALAARAPSGSADWTGSLLPFAALLLLLHRPLREWARAHPARLPGDAAWEAWRNLRDTLAARPPRPRPGPSPDARARLEGIGFAYGGGPAVFAGLDAAFDPGELTWVPGPNGCGKTTFLRLLAGVEAPDEGRILLPERLRQAPVAFAYLPQRAVMEHDFLTWAERLVRERPADWARLDGILDLAPLLARARLVAEGAGADGEAGEWAEALSGGQRQRLALARAFASGAPCLLLDEPTTWLSAADRERILGDLLAYWRETPGRGAVLVSHEAFLGEFCSQTLRLPEPASSQREAGSPAGESDPEGGAWKRGRGRASTAAGRDSAEAGGAA